MDAYLIVNLIKKHKKKLEKLNESSNSSNSSKSNSSMETIGLIIAILIGAYAAHLSYECNTKLKIPEFQKIIYAILAYIFGIIYLLYYFLFRSDACHTA